MAGAEVERAEAERRRCLITGQMGPSSSLVTIEPGPANL